MSRGDGPPWGNRVDARLEDLRACDADQIAEELETAGYPAEAIAAAAIKRAFSGGGGAGATGPAGQTGPQGATGPAGATGPQGPVGADSTTPGPAGATGPAGVQGAQGPLGPQGIQGAAGATGATGPQGVQGDQGIPGAPGADSTVAGPPGPQGPEGPAGAAGPAGADGPAGPAGATGATGPAGTAGAVGATGPQGTQGAAGAPGPVGPAGPAGATGVTGSTGATGATGPAGATGAQGSAASITAAWPVGSVFLSVVATSPATLLGFGTWAQIAGGRVLVGQTSGDVDFDTAEEVGGEKTHQLTVAEMPSHTHVQNAHSHTEQLQGSTTGATNGTNLMGSSATGGSLRSAAQSTLAATATNQNTGGDGAHNNMPPYLVVYMWKRTA